jgi:hypothetical protein
VKAALPLELAEGNPETLSQRLGRAFDKRNEQRFANGSYIAKAGCAHNTTKWEIHPGETAISAAA